LADLKKRLAMIEQRRTPSEPQIIIIRGGLCEFDDTRATIGGATIERDTAEPFPAFQARAIATAKAAGEGFVTIGGLPD